MNNWEHCVEKFGIKKLKLVSSDAYRIWYDSPSIFIEDKTRTIMINELPALPEPKLIYLRKVSLPIRLFRIFKKVVFIILES